MVPTKDMELKPKHLHVDSSGTCYLPYLNGWRAEVSSLLGLIYQLSSIFSLDPPVFSRVIENKPKIATNFPPTTNISINTNFSTSSSNITSPNPNLSSNTVSNTPNLNLQEGSQKTSREIVEEQLQEHLEVFQKQNDSEMQRYNHNKSLLEKSNSLLNSAIESYHLEIVSLKFIFLNFLANFRRKVNNIKFENQ